MFLTIPSTQHFKTTGFKTYCVTCVCAIFLQNITYWQHTHTHKTVLNLSKALIFPLISIMLYYNYIQISIVDDNTCYITITTYYYCSEDGEQHYILTECLFPKIFNRPSLKSPPLINLI